ncbi:MAG: peptidyl-prolyl cis-trans isomerase [Myxococcales bacterium]
MESSTQRAAAGKVVQVHYSLWNDKGEQIESSRDSDALTYLHGAGNIIPGLERAITGKAIGDTLEVSVAPADGYGDRDRPAHQPVPRSAFPKGAPLNAGMRFTTESGGGDVVPVWIAEVTEDTVFIDFNHPLAGQVLRFEVEVVGVRDATREEVAHGHPHGAGGHHH